MPKKQRRLFRSKRQSPFVSLLCGLWSVLSRSIFVISMLGFFSACILLLCAGFNIFPEAVGVTINFLLDFV